jgi:Alpha-galactosyl-binding fungal lectin
MKGSLDVGCGTYSYEITPAPKTAPVPPTPKLQCTPLSSEFFVTDDGIYQHIKDFCSNIHGLGPVLGGSKYPQLYNDKTPDLVIIEATFDGDGKNYVSQASEEDCNVAIKQLLDSCKGVDGKNQFKSWNRGTFIMLGSLPPTTKIY